MSRLRVHHKTIGRRAYVPRLTCGGQCDVGWLYLPSEMVLVKKRRYW